MTTATKTKTDPYDEITDRIIAALEAGVAPWRKPWTSAGTLPLSMSSGKPYRGLNVMLLALTALEQGYASPYWGTFKQINERGGNLKGAKSTVVTLWKTFRKVDPETGEPRTMFFLKTFRVFNADQAVWPEGSKRPVLDVELADHDPIAEAQAIIDGYVGGENGPAYRSIRSDSAHYVPATDSITVPELNQFATPEEFYSTAFHECGHSTGHRTRLARRELATFTHFGDEMYSKEELVAEMTAAFLCGHAGIETTLDNSAAYLANWLKALRNDKKLLVSAAGAAQKAADRIRGVSYAEPKEEVSA